MERKNGRRLKKSVMAVMLSLALVTGLSVTPANGLNPAGTVEAAAKKDKKKPVIKFAGKAKITVERNQVVKIPKTTAKDNKDGNITKKISVTVKKGKQSYKSIATKIKKNKKVKFSSVGKYTITYSVKDKAGNKASKKRTVTVVDSEKQTTTTETTEQQKTEEKTTQEQTTEQQTTEAPTPTDFSKYDIKEVTVDGRKYKITRDEEFYNDVIFKTSNQSDKLKITSRIDGLRFELSTGLLENSEYLKYYGDIKAIDKTGNDISDRIIIFDGRLANPYEDMSSGVWVYVEDSNGNSLKRIYTISLSDSKYVDSTQEVLSETPYVVGYLSSEAKSSLLGTSKNLEYIDE